VREPFRCLQFGAALAGADSRRSPQPHPSGSDLAFARDHGDPLGYTRVTLVGSLMR
jgi:hypothetical protein